MTLLAPVDRVLRTRAFYWSVFAACLIPGAILAWQFYQAATGAKPDALGSDPVKETLHTTGRYAITLVLLALTVTPARRFLGLNALQKVRRMVGVWGFVYATLHLSTYLIFDQLCYSPSTCQWHDIWVDFTKRKFTFMGLTAYTVLLLLAVTSTNGWIRRLGKRWTSLHRWIYVGAVAAAIHFVWGQKSAIRLPLEYSAVLAVLLGARVVLTIQKRQAKAAQRIAPGLKPGPPAVSGRKP
jgi:sulfoxide reductase heme-binding subunit YedZ